LKHFLKLRANLKKYIAQKCFGHACRWMLHALVVHSVVTGPMPGSVFSDSP